MEAVGKNQCLIVEQFYLSSKYFLPLSECVLTDYVKYGKQADLNPEAPELDCRPTKPSAKMLSGQLWVDCVAIAPKLNA